MTTACTHADFSIDNDRWEDAQPVLSILIPFKGDDPIELLAALDRDDQQAEVVVLDDGTGDEGLAQRVSDAVAGLKMPARFIHRRQNLGRSKGRNLLVQRSRAAHMLFLDSDMRPDHPSFVDRWVEVARTGDEPVVFGGFSVEEHTDRTHRLHRALAMGSDCADAATRSASPEKYVFTSNLVVRRDVFQTQGFDERFAGWGWEDVEWGIRVSRSHRIGHIDNTATHLGLDTAEGLITKYEQSGKNFGLVVAEHHDIVSNYPAYKAARVLKKVPLRRAWQPLLRKVTLTDALPLRLRALTMRLYRSSLYSEVV